MNTTIGGDYIKLKIKYFISSHPEAQISYEFDKDDNAHLIKFSPAELRCDDDFKSWASSIIREAANEFPVELVVFLDNREDVIKQEG